MDPFALLAEVPAPVTRGTMRVSRRSELLEPGTMVGEYRIERHVAAGGMGDIYAASHPVIGKRAAVKILGKSLCRSANMVQRFVQEARVVNAIGHANIVDIFSLGELPDGRVFLIMEWLDGEHFHARLRRGGLAVSEVCQILEPVIDAVEAAHRAGVVHRDLKPANIYLARPAGGEIGVKLLDFGIAKLIGPSAEEATPTPKTEVGVVLGTPGYLAPEQEVGGVVGPPADVYAFGVVLYMALFGQRPFEAVDDRSSSTPPSYIRSPKAVCPDLPDEIAEVMLRTFAESPALRPSWTELRETLRQLREGPLRLRVLTPRPADPGAGYFSADTETIAELSPTRSDRSGRVEDGARQRRVRGAAIGVGLVLGAAVLLFLVTRHGESPVASPAKGVDEIGGATLTARVEARPVPLVAATARDSGVAGPVDSGTDDEADASIASRADSGVAELGVAGGAHSDPAGPLTVVVGARNAIISVDGRVVSRGRSRKVISGLTAGLHRVRISAPRHQLRTLEVELHPGQAKEIVVELERARARRPRPKEQQRGRAIGDPPKKPSSETGRDLDYTVDPFGSR